MKYEQLKSNLKNKVESLYLFFGEDLFLLDNSLKLIKQFANIEMPEINISQYSEGEIDCGAIVKELETMPAFSEKKLVYIDITSKNSKLINEKKLNEYLTNLNESSILVLNIGMMPKPEKVDLEKFVEVDCNKLSTELVSKFVVANLKQYNKKITLDALNTLIDYTLGDLQVISSEITKLCNFVGEKEQISLEDISFNVKKSLEYQIFELTEGLGKKDFKKTFEILDDIKLGGKPKSRDSASGSSAVKGLFSLIYNHFRRLFFVSLNSYSKSEYAKYLKIQEYAITKIMAQLKFFTSKRLKEIIDLCSDFDFKIKQSQIQEWSAIEIICLNILNQ